MSSNSSRLVIFFKEPIPGKVKTRLAKTLGPERATHLYKCLLAKTIREAKASGIPFCMYRAGVQTRRSMLAYPQRGRDLGERMRGAFDRELKRGFKKIVIIGADCPMLSGRLICSAFQALRGHDAVLGPTSDGGYYLIGLNLSNESPSDHVRMKEMFRGVRWGGAKVYEATYGSLIRLGLSVKRLRLLTDWDRESDIEIASLAALYA